MSAVALAPEIACYIAAMFRRLEVIFIIVFASACGGGDDGGEPDAGISPSCMEATAHSDLAWLQDNVFTPSCAAFSSCHMGAASLAEGLNLEAGMTEANLVGVASTQVSSLELVAPGDPDNSYLIIKLGRGNFPPGAETTTMPLGNPLLCDEKIDAVVRWIDSL